MPIYFHTEDIQFKLQQQREIKRWVKGVIEDFKEKPGELNYIFCSDDHILEINKQYLDHDYYTDIITFDYSEKSISGDIFVSVDRVRDNANTLKLNFEEELHRVLIHGILHLLGLKDKSKNEQKEMQLAENQQLAKRSWINVPRET